MEQHVRGPVLTVVPTEGPPGGPARARRQRAVPPESQPRQPAAGLCGPRAGELHAA